MAVKIRLARAGAKKKPFYRIVVANATAPRDGDFIEIVGTYDPMLKTENANKVVLKQDRITFWLNQGAKPTERVALFLLAQGVALPEKVQKEVDMKIKNRKARAPRKAA